jgi:hypothetical protein
MISERGTDLIDAEIDASLEIYKRVFGPKGTLNLFAGHDLSGPLRKKQKDSEGLRMYLQTYLPPLNFR